MPDYYEKLRVWYQDLVDANGESNCKDLYFIEESEIKIPFLVVESLINNYYGEKEYCQQIEEMLAERDDFIRLLRKENKELREKYEDR